MNDHDHDAEASSYVSKEDILSALRHIVSYRRFYTAPLQRQAKVQEWLNRLDSEQQALALQNPEGEGVYLAECLAHLRAWSEELKAQLQVGWQVRAFGDALLPSASAAAPTTGIAKLAEMLVSDVDLVAIFLEISENPLLDRWYADNEKTKPVGTDYIEMVHVDQAIEKVQAQVVAEEHRKQRRKILLVRANLENRHYQYVRGARILVKQGRQEMADVAQALSTYVAGQLEAFSGEISLTKARQIQAEVGETLGNSRDWEVRRQCESGSLALPDGEAYQHRSASWEITVNHSGAREVLDLAQSAPEQYKDFHTWIEPIIHHVHEQGYQRYSEHLGLFRDSCKTGVKLLGDRTSKIRRDAMNNGDYIARLAEQVRLFVMINACVFALEGQCSTLPQSINVSQRGNVQAMTFLDILNSLSIDLDRLMARQSAAQVDQQARALTRIRAWIPILRAFDKTSPFLNKVLDELSGHVEAFVHEAEQCREEVARSERYVGNRLLLPSIRQDVTRSQTI